MTCLFRVTLGALFHDCLVLVISEIIQHPLVVKFFSLTSQYILWPSQEVSGMPFEKTIIIIHHIIKCLKLKSKCSTM